MNKIMKKMEMGQQVEGKFKKKKVNQTVHNLLERVRNLITLDEMGCLKAVREDDNL